MFDQDTVQKLCKIIKIFLYGAISWLHLYTIRIQFIIAPLHFNVVLLVFHFQITVKVKYTGYLCRKDGKQKKEIQKLL